MKTKMIAASALLAATALTAQPIVDFKSMPVATIFTGTTCGPCGTWGWTQWQELYSNPIYKDNAVLIKSNCSYYDGGTPMLKTTYATAWESIHKVAGYPTFAVNNSSIGQPEIKTYITNETGKAKEIGINFEAKIIGSNIRVIRYVKSNGAITGNFELNTMVIEDSVKATQSGQTGTVNHRYVLRKTSTLISKTGAKGTSLPSQALSGNLWKDTLSIAIEQTNWVSWKQKDLKIALVLFKDGIVYNGYTRDNTFQELGSTPTFALTVTGGTGDGSYESGKTVTITAEVPSGKEFVKWSSADGVVFADANKSTTTITTLGKTATVTAEFKDAAVVSDTANLSVNLLSFGSWSVSADSYGSTATIDTTSVAQKVGATFALVAGDETKEIYPWGSLSTSYTKSFSEASLFKVTYSASKPIGLVLSQGTLSEDGVSFGVELPAADTTLYLKKELFLQPSWTPDSLKTTLDLSQVSSISFEATALNATTLFYLSELKATNYEPDPVSVRSALALKNSNFSLNGLTLNIGSEIANGVVRVIGFNGRVLVEQVISGSSVNLGAMNLASGVYMVSVKGRDFASPATRFMIP